MKIPAELVAAIAAAVKAELVAEMPKATAVSTVAVRAPKRGKPAKAVTMAAVKAAKTAPTADQIAAALASPTRVWERQDAIAVGTRSGRAQVVYLCKGETGEAAKPWPFKIPADLLAFIEAGAAPLEGTLVEGDDEDAF